MARAALLGLALVLTAAPARADVRVAPEVPFEAAQLERSLAARGLAVDVEVAGDGPGAVQVVTAAGSRRIDLGPARGSSAARLVALHLAALPLPEAVPPAVAAATSPVAEVGSGVALTLGAGAGRGLERHDIASARLAAGVRGVDGPWRWRAGLVWSGALSALGDETTALGGSDVVVGHVGAGVGAGRVEVTAGPLLGGYRVDGGAASGWMTGVSGGARVALARVGRWQLRAALDVDLWEHRVVAQVDGDTVAATPRAAIAAGLDLAWELAR